MRSFVINVVMIGILSVVFYLYETRPYTPSMIRGNDWIPNNNFTCGLPECDGIIAFDTPGCDLKEDGFIYDHDKPRAQLVESKQPFIPESAPRTGSYIYFRVLDTKDICGFESTF